MCFLKIREYYGFLESLFFTENIISCSFSWSFCGFCSQGPHDLHCCWSKVGCITAQRTSDSSHYTLHTDEELLATWIYQSYPCASCLKFVVSLPRRLSQTLAETVRQTPSVKPLEQRVDSLPLLATITTQCSHYKSLPTVVKRGQHRSLITAITT